MKKDVCYMDADGLLKKAAMHDGEETVKAWVKANTLRLVPQDKFFDDLMATPVYFEAKSAATGVARVHVFAFDLECETTDCAYNTSGICRFRGVYDRDPVITEDEGCTEGVIDFQRGE